MTRRALLALLAAAAAVVTFVLVLRLIPTALDSAVSRVRAEWDRAIQRERKPDFQRDTTWARLAAMDARAVVPRIVEEFWPEHKATFGDWPDPVEHLVAKMGLGAVPGLLVLLEHPNVDVLYWTISQLEELDATGDDVIRALERRLDDDKPLVRLFACEALAHRAEPVEPLVRRITAELAHEDADVRSTAIEFLVSVAGAQAWPDVERMVADPKWDVAYCALSALWKLDTKKAVPVWIRAMKDAEYAQVSRVLDWMDSPWGAKELPEVYAVLRGVPWRGRMSGRFSMSPVWRKQFADLLMEGLADPDPAVAHWAGEMLAKTAEPAAYDVARLGPALRHSQPATRTWAVDSAANAGRDAAQVLIEALRDPAPAVRARAAEHLGQVECPQAREALRAALQDPDWSARASAAVAFLRYEPESADALRVIESSLHGATTGERCYTLRLLRAAGPPALAARKLVEAAVEGATQDVRDLALEALRSMDGRTPAR